MQHVSDDSLSLKKERHLEQSRDEERVSRHKLLSLNTMHTPVFFFFFFFFVVVFVHESHPFHLLNINDEC